MSGGGGLGCTNNDKVPSHWFSNTIPAPIVIQAEFRNRAESEKDKMLTQEDAETANE